MDRFSKERKTKYTYTHTHSLSSHFIADFLKTFFSVKKKKEKTEGKHFLFITGRKNRINYYSEVQKSLLYLQISFSFQLLEYHCLRIVFIISKEYSDRQRELECQ